MRNIQVIQRHLEDQSQVSAILSSVLAYLNRFSVEIREIMGFCRSSTNLGTLLLWLLFVNAAVEVFLDAVSLSLSFFSNFFHAAYAFFSCRLFFNVTYAFYRYENERCLHYAQRNTNYISERTKES